MIGNLTVNGSIYVAESYDGYSDISLKKDFEDAYNYTDNIKNIEGVSFQWKDDEDCKTHYGVIAQ